MTLIGTTLNGRFTLEKELGRGGMGAVYRATDSILGRKVAIKVLKDVAGDDLGHRIRLEAQILARLVHHHIVRLYDFNADVETYYFIMEEVDGTSFARRVKKIPLAGRMRVVAEAAEALDYAHHQGVIHRDVKPANILLTASDQAKLSDFGLSLLSDASQESGVVRGTPHYMSPEQAKGKKIDHRTDLYALGVILYECATGTPPFTGPVMTVMAQHVNAEPEPPRAKNPEVSEELEALILSLMAKDPSDRPGSGLEVSARVRSLLASGRYGENVPAGVDAPHPSAASRSAGTNVSDAPSMNASGVSVATAARSMGAASRARTPAKAPGRDLALKLVQAVTAEPIQLSPDERYLHGHYLAYLLGGSRRRGFFLRRPLDPLNADRARLMLVMAALTQPEAEVPPLAEVAKLLDDKPDVRPMLSPVVVAKYLSNRDTPAKRRKFRQIRQQLQQASEHAARHMTNETGVLNPGLMPQVIDDLKRLAPERTEVDDRLVERWNRVTEVWRGNPEFRMSVLRYATKSAAGDPSSAELWPEVVYPLIERARRQRQLRSGTEAFRDAVFGSLLHIGDVGVKLDQAIRRSVPVEVVRDLDVSLARIVDEAEAEVIPPEPAPAPSTRAVDLEAMEIKSNISPASFHDLEVDQPTRSFVRLINPDPLRQSMGELREMWKEAIAAMKAGAAATMASRHVPLGLYRMMVVASIRSRSAGQVAIQGMVNKQIELLVPPFTSGGPASKLIVAIWLYTNNSMAITYLDNLNNQKYIFWDTTTTKQSNFDHPDDFAQALYAAGVEAPDQLDRALTNAYRPHNAV